MFFKERLLALGVSYLKVGLKAPVFFLFMVQQFSFCFFIQADSSVRFAQFDLKVTDQLPKFFPYFEYKADKRSIFF